ncbi:MAG: hypothetical protein R2751_07640 [Bacteroidales bacterium]
MSEEPLPEPVPAAEKSTLSAKLSRGEQVVLVEMVPPRSSDVAKNLEGARLLKEARVDAVNIPDGPRASARMTGLALAVILERGRDRDGAALHLPRPEPSGHAIRPARSHRPGHPEPAGHHGRSPMMGDYPKATAVFDIDAIGLVHLIDNLNHGIDIGEKRIGDPTAFSTGVGMDPNSVNVENEIGGSTRKGGRCGIRHHPACSTCPRWSRFWSGSIWATCT